MAIELQIARSTIQRALNRLEELGWIERCDKRRADGGRCSLVYIVNYGVGSAGGDTSTEALPAVDNCPEKAGVAAPMRHATPERCSSYKNAKSYNAFQKTDIVDRIKSAKPFPPSRNPELQKLVVSINELRKRAKEAAPYIERVKQQLLFVGIHLEHSSVSDGIETILEWHDLGADVDLDIAPMLQKVTARCNQPPRSLKYFSKAIQNSLKRRRRPNKR